MILSLLESVILMTTYVTAFLVTYTIGDDYMNT